MALQVLAREPWELFKGMLQSQNYFHPRGYWLFKDPFYHKHMVEFSKGYSMCEVTVDWMQKQENPALLSPMLEWFKEYKHPHPSEFLKKLFLHKNMIYVRLQLTDVALLSCDLNGTAS